jgi:hypothetical protein
VAKRVVDGLEVIQVQAEHRRAVPPAYAGELLFQLNAEVGAVRQPGEHVVVRQI